MPPRGVDVRVSLPAVVRDVGAGHRLRLVVSTTDQAYALPAATRYYTVSLAGTRRCRRPRGAHDGPGWRGPGATVAVGRRSRRRHGPGRGRLRRARAPAPGGPANPALIDVPLSIKSLGKPYPGGVKAVTDVSFRVEPGQVLGLLGPNGAGKTTTLRMVMGLITPTEGEIRVFGHRCGPGSPILSRVGASSRVPGSCRTCPGGQTWSCTGRPPAGRRRTRTWRRRWRSPAWARVDRRSAPTRQGMRQRLAIAQAMLGLPDLLLMDEPTNGLDPPQIHAMREVLRRYAGDRPHRARVQPPAVRGGADLHPCGRRAPGPAGGAGPVTEIVGSATALLVDVDQPERAAKVAASVDGARTWRSIPAGSR